MKGLLATNLIRHLETFYLVYHINKPRPWECLSSWGSASGGEHFWLILSTSKLCFVKQIKENIVMEVKNICVLFSILHPYAELQRWWKLPSDSQMFTLLLCWRRWPFNQFHCVLGDQWLPKSSFLFSKLKTYSWGNKEYILCENNPFVLKIAISTKYYLLMKRKEKSERQSTAGTNLRCVLPELLFLLLRWFCTTFIVLKYSLKSSNPHLRIYKPLVIL